MPRTIPLRDGRRLRIEERGHGDVTLLLHGFMGSAAAWGERVLAALACTRHVVAVDLPGHGGSDRSTEPERYVLEEVVQDVVDLLGALDVDAATWIGYSMGGRLALGAAALHPDRVRALVLESASPGLADADARAGRRRDDETLALKLETEGMEAFAAWWAQRPLFRRAAEPVGDGTPERLRTIQTRNDPAALAACLRGGGSGVQPSLWDHLDRLNHPTLLITGREDPKFTSIAAAMAERLPAARHIVVPNAGHRVHVDQPDAWLRAVRAFLG